MARAPLELPRRYLRSFPQTALRLSVFITQCSPSSSPVPPALRSSTAPRGPPPAAGPRAMLLRKEFTGRCFTNRVVTRRDWA